MTRRLSGERSWLRLALSATLLLGVTGSCGLLPASASAAPPPTPATSSDPMKLGVGISLAEAKSKLAELGYTFKESPLGVEATAPSGIFTVILSGPADDLTWIGALMGLPNDDKVRTASLVHLVAYLHITMDGWTGGGDWVAANTQASIGRDVSVERGRRRLTMRYTPSLGIVNFGVEGVVPEAERRLADARAALAEGDTLLSAGRADDAIATWGRAERVDETRASAQAKILDARVGIVRAHLDAQRFDDALRASRDIPDGERKATLVVEAARGLLPTSPGAALAAFDSSATARSQDQTLYRSALLGTARQTCSSEALEKYEAAQSIEPLTRDDASAAAACASSLGARSFESEDYRASLGYLRVGATYDSQQSGVVDLRRDLTKAKRNPGVIPGIALVAGGAGLAATSGVFWSAATNTSASLRAEERSTEEVDALISKGAASQTTAWALTGGGLALIGGGVAAFVLGADRVPEELRGVDLAVVPMEHGAMAMITVREF